MMWHRCNRCVCDPCSSLKLDKSIKGRICDTCWSEIQQEHKLAAAAAHLENVEMKTKHTVERQRRVHGVVCKQSDHLKAWPERYFEIVGSELRYWESETKALRGDAPKNTLHLPECSLGVEPQSKTADGPQIFTLSNGSCCWRLKVLPVQAAAGEACEEPNNEDTWIGALQKAGATSTEDSATWYSKVLHVVCEVFTPCFLNFLREPWPGKPWGLLALMVCLLLRLSSSVLSSTYQFGQSGGDLILLHRCYTQLYSLFYLGFNMPLILLIGTKLHGMLQKRGSRRRHSTVWATLIQQLPQVIEQYKTQLMASLLPPMVIWFVNLLVDIGLPANAELPVTQIPTLVVVLLLILYPTIIIIDYSYLKDSYITFVTEEKGDILVSLDQAEAVLNLLNQLKVGKIGWLANKCFGAVDLFNNRVVDPLVRKGLSGAISTICSDDDQLKLKEFYHRLIYNILLVGVFRYFDTTALPDMSEADDE